MFICQNCDRVVEPRTPMTKVITRTRAASYPFRKDATTRKVGGKVEKVHDKGGQGYETVKEICVCPDCVAKVEAP